ncbi:MAG: cytochrome c [Candidatus Acidiferrum sp.]
MKRGSILLMVGVAVVGVVVAIAASLLHDGLSSRATPSKLEAVIARNAHRLAIPSDARSTQNPVVASEEDLRAARLHFADHCAMCHDNDGGGQTLYGKGLYPPPPDLRLPATQNLTDGELFWIIENGVRFTGMPAFATAGNHNGHGGALDSWKLVHFIRHLPHLTPAERVEMERYNPKGQDERAEEQEENNFLNGATPKAKPESQNQHPR